MVSKNIFFIWGILLLIFPTVCSASFFESQEGLNLDFLLGSSTSPFFDVIGAEDFSVQEISYDEKNNLADGSFLFEHPKILEIENEIGENKKGRISTLEDIEIPKVIKQEQIKLDYNEIRNDLNLKKTYDYAVSLGYTELNNSVQINYADGSTGILLTLLAENKKPVFLLKVNGTTGGVDCSEGALLMEFGIVNNTPTLTVFNEEAGLVMNMDDYSVVSEWGHHSCTWWSCWKYCYDALGGIAISQGICSGFRAACVGSLFLLPEGWPAVAAACTPFAICLGFAPAACSATCVDECSWYPCQDDCDEYDEYGGWENYCNGNYVYEHRVFYDSFCPSEYGPGEGQCALEGYYVDDTLVKYCPYGCEDGDCENPVTCYSDIECGEDRWVGSRYCSGGDVWQNRKEYDCHNPGTSSSYCDYDITPKLREDCDGSGCSDGECEEPPECSGPNEYWCNDQCWSFCGAGTVLCCPSSGNPFQCYDEAGSVCMSDGSICSPVPETCNNLDDDCDGIIDNFSEGCGIGACYGGERTCVSGSWGECSTTNNSSDETCNNVDDDCDGFVDENLTQECGTDVGICSIGVQTCSVGVWSECGGDYVGPANETCNSLDDNCNDLVDENNVCGDYPNGTLISPANDYISYTGDIVFNCSAKDDSGLSNITLYHNANGNMSANETKSLSGISDSATWAINDLPHGTSFIWNCLIYDVDSHSSWASNVSYSVNVTIVNQPPIVALDSPQNGKLFAPYINDVIFNSSVQDLEGLSNCTLYTNTTGAWGAIETQAVSGTSDIASFEIENISNGIYLWNVKCYDEENNYSWAPNNWTFAINYTGESYCHELNEDNLVYELVNDLHSEGTCFNITAENVTIDGNGHTLFYAESSDGWGIVNFGYNKTTVEDINLVLDRPGLSGAKSSSAIYFRDGKDHNITSVDILTKGQTSSTGKCHGIYFDDVSYSTIKDVLINTSNTYNSHGIYLYADSKNQRYNRIYGASLYANGFVSSGIYLWGVNNGGIRDIIVGDSSSYSERWHGAYIRSGTTGTGNTFVYNSSFESSNEYGLYLYGAEDTFVKDSDILSLNSYDVVSNDNDHVLLNVNCSDESISGGSLIRAWYLDIRVNDSYGNDVYQANVSGGDVFGSLDFSELTDLTGRISTQGLGEYIDNGTKTYYNNYWVNVTKSGFFPATASVNFTETQNTFLVITLQNSLPYLLDAVLNSSFGTNSTSENLTVYVSVNDSDGDSVENTYNWYKNNNSLASLLLMFNGERNLTFTKDYSNRGNDAQITGAIWDPTGGYDNSGAYTFAGEDERLIVSDSDSVDMNGNFTVLARVYSKTPTYALAIKGSLDSKEDYRLYSWDGYLRFRWGNGSESGLASCDGCTEQTDEWLFIGAVYKCDDAGSSVDFYINGEYNTTENSNVTCVKGGTSDLWIGSRENLAYTLNGTIDDVMIYGHSLSAVQIKAIYENRTNEIVSDETSVGDIYKCEITPYDGKEDGESVNTTDLLVLSGPDITPPSISFVSPTPANGSSQAGSSIYINVFSSDENNHYTFVDCDKSALLWMRMDDMGKTQNYSNIVEDETEDEWNYTGDCESPENFVDEIWTTSGSADNPGNGETKTCTWYINYTKPTSVQSAVVEHKYSELCSYDPELGVLLVNASMSVDCYNGTTWKNIYSASCMAQTVQNSVPAECLNSNKTQFRWIETKQDLHSTPEYGPEKNSLYEERMFWNVSSDDSVVDLSSYSNNGTIHGSAEQADGYFGDSFDFGGAYDYIKLSNANNLGATNVLAISAWIKPETSSLVSQPIIAKLNKTSGTRNYMLSLNSYYLNFSSGSNSVQSSSLALNEWHHVGVVFNDSSGNITLYKDGAKVFSQVASSSLVSSSGEYAVIGVDNLNGTANYFGGKIDAVLVFNRSLSDSEMQSLYNASAYQYHNNFTNLAVGAHKFTAHASDIEENWNSTEERVVTVQ